VGQGKIERPCHDCRLPEEAGERPSHQPALDALDRGHQFAAEGLDLELKRMNGVFEFDLRNESLPAGCEFHLHHLEDRTGLVRRQLGFFEEVEAVPEGGRAARPCAAGFCG